MIVKKRHQLHSQLRDIIKSDKELQKIEKKTFEQLYKEYTKVYDSVQHSRVDRETVNEIYKNIILICIAIIIIEYLYSKFFDLFQSLFIDDKSAMKTIISMKKVLRIYKIVSTGTKLITEINKYLKILYINYYENNKRVNPVLIKRIHRINNKLTDIYDKAKQAKVAPVEVYLTVPSRQEEHPPHKAQATRTSQKQIQQAYQFIRNAPIIQDVTEQQSENRPWYNTPQGSVYRYRQQQLKK